MSGSYPESDASYGPNELDYYPIGSGSEWYAKWMPASPAPRRGYKIHVSTDPRLAQAVARIVLPALRAMNIFHKVVRDQDRYRRHLATSAAGKFITIYTTGDTQRNSVIQRIDTELSWLGRNTGPVPTARVGAGAGGPETALGRSGYLFGRPYDENSGDD